MPGPGWSTHKLNPNRMQIERKDSAIDLPVVDYLETVSRGALEDYLLKTLKQPAEEHWSIKHFCGSDGGNWAKALKVSRRVACDQNPNVRFRIEPGPNYEQRVSERNYVELKEQRAQERKAMHAARKDCEKSYACSEKRDSRATDLHFGAQRECSENEASAKIDDGVTCCLRCNVQFWDRHGNLFCCSSCRHNCGHTPTCMRRRCTFTAW